VLEDLFGQMEVFTREDGTKTKLTDGANILITMAKKNTLVNLLMGKKKGSV